MTTPKRAVACSVGAAGLVALAIGIVGTAQTAHAEEPQPPRLPRAIAVGSTSGPSPHAGVDLGRTNRARDRLPIGGMRLAWTAPGSDTGLALVTNSNIVLTGADLLGYDLQGKKLWGMGTEWQPVGVAGLLADGTVVALQPNGSVDGVREGVLKFRRLASGPVREEQRGTGVLPLADGGFLAHWGDMLIWYDGEGRVRDSVRSVVAYRFGSPMVVLGGAAYGATLGGAVYRVREAADPAWVGAFGGAVESIAAFGADSLVGVVAADRVVALSTTSGAVTVLGRAESGERLGPALATTRGRVCTTARQAAQVSVVCFEKDKPGAVLRAPVDTLPVVMSDAGTLVPFDTPALLIDDAFTVAYSSGRGSVVVRADGRLVPLVPWLCAGGGRSYIAPAGPGAVITSCGREMRKFTGDFGP